MKSNNPVFNNSPAFNGQGGYAAPQGQGYATPYGNDPSQWGTGMPAPTATRGMTIDDVVQKTGVSLGIVVVVAFGLWIATGDLTSSTDGNFGLLAGATMLGMVGTLGLGLYATFSRKMLSPALVLAYAALEGLFMGGVSKVVALTEGGDIVIAALLGTVAAGGGVLAAYKFFDIKVGDKFRKGFFAFVMGFLAIGVLEMVLSAFGSGIGLFGDGGMGLLFALAGLGIGLVGLLLDFDMIEDAIRYGVEEKFAWTAAFGLTASIVTVYFYLLRLLSILNQD